MQMTPYYYDMTEYPKIFKNSHWGNFDRYKKHKIEDIITNRNNFVKEFEIVKKKDIPKKYHKYFNFEKRNDEHRPFYDHVEEYKTKNNNYLVICSPYTNYDELAEKLGYKKYNQLYSSDAFTYIKTYQTKKYLKMD